MNNSKRVLVAGLFHETHTFLEGETGWDKFSVLTGAELFTARGDSSPLGGVLAEAERFGWDVQPGVMAVAAPSAIVCDQVWDRYCRLLEEQVRQCEQGAAVEAVFLVLHGAMVCRGVADVEGELLTRLRSWLKNPAVPIFGVYDLHANFTPEMAERAECLVAYRCNPHRDARESAVRAAGLLQRSLETGEVPRTYYRQPPLLWPPTGTGSDTEPMQSLLARARELQTRYPDFWEVNVNAGFSFADIHAAGVSFTVVSGGAEEDAERALDELCELALELAEQGNVVEADVDEVLPKLLPPPPGLTVLVEPADNIGGGAPGDCTGLLRAILRHELPKAAVCLCDPQGVQQLQTVAVGSRVTLPLGGRGSRLDAGPLELEVELLALCDGLFELRDKQSHLASMSGDTFDMGPCAVVRHGAVTLLLTSIKTPPMDLGQWLHVGIDPTEFCFVGVKAAVSHRRAWDVISARNVWVGTPGPCSSRMSEFPFVNVRRPIYPLDELEIVLPSWETESRQLQSGAASD